MSDNPRRGRGRPRRNGNSRRSSSGPASTSAAPASTSAAPALATSPDNRCDELKNEINTIETTFGQLSEGYKNEKAKTTQLETEKQECDNEKAGLQDSVNTL